MNLWQGLLVTFALLILNAYFVGAEFAVMGARRSRVEPMVENGNWAAKKVLYALENVTLMLATCQLGVTLASVALGAVSEPVIAHAIAGPLGKVGVSEDFVHPIAIVVALVIVVFLHVVLGEMVPKNLAVTSPEKAALFLGPPLVLVAKIFMPIVYSLNWLANHVIRLFGFEPKHEVASAFTADEVASIVEVSKEAGVLNDDVGLLSGALEFSEKTAAETMIPLDQLEYAPLGASPADIEDMVAQTGFSRFPVRSAGHIIGYVHVKDLLDSTPAKRHEPMPEWKIRGLVEVRADDEVESALRVMQRGGVHVAAVWDQDVIGLLFLEDVLEELVGEVRDAMQR